MGSMKWGTFTYIARTYGTVHAVKVFLCRQCRAHMGWSFTRCPVHRAEGQRIKGRA